MITLENLKNKIKSEKEFPISEEIALNQLCEILKYYDLDLERLTNYKDSKRSGEQTFNAIIRFFRQGKIEVKKDEKQLIKIIQHRINNEIIEYRRIDAKAKKIMDEFDTEATYQRLYGFMANLAGWASTSTIDNMHPQDLAVLECLGVLFLLV